MTNQLLMSVEFFDQCIFISHHKRIPCAFCFERLQAFINSLDRASVMVMMVVLMGGTLISLLSVSYAMMLAHKGRHSSLVTLASV